MSRLNRWMALLSCLVPLSLATTANAQDATRGPGDGAPVKATEADLRQYARGAASEQEPVETRIRFARELAKAGPRAKDAAPALIAVLLNGKDYITMKRVRLKANDLFPEEAEYVPDHTWEFRLEIVRALDAMGPAVAPQAVRAYATLLAQLANRMATSRADDARPGTQNQRDFAARTDELADALFERIAQEGPGARVAVPTLIALVRVNHPTWLTRAVHALGKIGDPRAREVLDTLRLRSPHASHRAAAARALRRLEAAAP